MELLDPFALPPAPFELLGRLADMQPLTSLAAEVPGVVQWKP